MQLRVVSLWAIGVSGLALVGCGHRQYQQLGMGRITVTGQAGVDAPAVSAPGATGAAAAGAPVEVPVPELPTPARYRIAYQIWLPRALEVQWTVRCAGHQTSGVVGEDLATYRARRVAELEAERERQRQAAAQVGSVVGGALLGQAQAGATTTTAAGTASATVTVDGAAAGAAAGASLVEDQPIVLAADDLGQGYRQGAAQLRVDGGGGACTMDLTPLDPAEDGAGLTGAFSVERWFDGRQVERVRVASGAASVRTDLRAHLIARGADPAAAARRRAAAWAQAQAQHQAELAAQAEARLERDRLAAEAQRERDRLAAEAAASAERRRLAEQAARLELETRIRVGVRTARAGLAVYLQHCGGDPHHRQRVAAEEQQRRHQEIVESRVRLRVALDVRSHLRGLLIARGADPDLRARLAAQATRARAEAARVARAQHEAARAAEAAARAEAERQQEEARAAYRLRRRAEEREARLRFEAELAAEVAARAEAERRYDVAMGVRAVVADRLVAAGAVLRPPMPDPVLEVPGPSPGDGAWWVAGNWSWDGVAWRWSSGHWAGGPAIVTVTVDGGGAVFGDAGGPALEHRSTVGDILVPPPRQPVRDHRPPSSEPPRPVTTRPAPPTPPPTAAPRGGGDRRTDRDDRDDERPRVRDHR